MTEAQAEYDGLVKESLEREALAQLNEIKRFNGFMLCLYVMVCMYVNGVYVYAYYGVCTYVCM